MREEIDASSILALSQTEARRGANASQEYRESALQYKQGNIEFVELVPVFVTVLGC